MDWFSFWLNNVTLAAQGCLQLSFAGHFTGKRLRARHFAAFLFLIYAGDRAAAVFRSDVFAYGMVFLALYGTSRLALGNSRPVSAVTSVLAVYVAQLSFGVLNPLESLLFPRALGHMPLIYALVWTATLLSLALCFFCYRFLSKRFSLRDGRREPYIWMLLPPGMFFFAVELYILYTAYGRAAAVPSQIETGRHLSLLVLQLLGLGALYCALYAYERTCDGFRAQAALASLAQETRAQRAYVAEAQMRYERTRAFRHDIKNHLSVLDGLLRDGNVEQAQGYLQKLETVTGGLSLSVHTGNPVVDVLLRGKLELARTRGVKTELSIVLPEPCGVDDLDLCVIFANALDNAVQACTQADGPGWIRAAGERQGDFYMLEFENTCSSDSDPEMGTGLSNIKAVAEKYGGAMTLEKNCSLFRLHVLLNISVTV